MGRIGRPIACSRITGGREALFETADRAEMMIYSNPTWLHRMIAWERQIVGSTASPAFRTVYRGPWFTPGSTVSSCILSCSCCYLIGKAQILGFHHPLQSETPFDFTRCPPLLLKGGLTDRYGSLDLKRNKDFQRCA
jgi:hypothetical protein